MNMCVELFCLGQIVEASGDTDVQRNYSAKRPKTNRPILQFIPSTVSSDKLELNSFQLVTPMIREIGNVLFSTYSVELLMGRIKWLVSANLWRTREPFCFPTLLFPTPSLPSSSRSHAPCVDSTRLRVYIQNASVCTGKKSTCFRHVDLFLVHTETF